MQVQPKISVMIVSDNPIMRDGLRLRVEQETDMYVVCDAGDVAQTLRDFHRCRPDVLVIDLQSPRGAGLRARDAIRELSPATPFVVLEDYAAEPGACRGTGVGSTVIVPKMSANEQVIPAIRRALSATHCSSGASRR